MTKILKLNRTAPVVRASRLLLVRIKEQGWFDIRKNEDKIYRNALIEFLVNNPYYLEQFVFGGTIDERIGYRNHIRDKNGKLVKVEAYEIHGQ